MATGKETGRRRNDNRRSGHDASENIAGIPVAGNVVNVIANVLGQTIEVSIEVIPRV